MKKTGLIVVMIVVFLSGTFCPVMANSVTNKMQGVAHSVTPKREQVVIYLDQKAKYNEMMLQNPFRIVIDILDTVTTNGYTTKGISSNSIETIRFAQYDTRTVRVVIDLKSECRYELKQNERLLILYIYKSCTSGNNDDNPEDGKDTSNNNKPDNNSNNAPDNDTQTPDEDNSEFDNGITDRQGDRISDASLDIKHSTMGVSEQIKMNIPGYKDYDYMRLSGGDRIVLDFKSTGAVPGLTTKKINSNFVDSIRYAQYDRETIRVVVDLKGQYDFTINEIGSRIVIYIRKPDYYNLLYHNTGDRVFLELDNILLTGGDKSEEKHYQTWFDSSKRNFTVSFKENVGSVGSGIININDKYLKHIKVDKSKNTGNTTITFAAKDRFKYNVSSRSLTRDTAITLIRPFDVDERLVVIDPGHGGKEPGAIYGGIHEKDINLDIALRLNKLLAQRNIKTYMTRKDDSYVGLYERAYIANELNAALFLSIHNNAMPNNDKFKGTMTFSLMGPNGTSFTGYEFAQIVHKHLIGNLRTLDKGVRTANFAVLRETVMPSVLAEIAFMSNKEELKKLMDPSFKQAAAQALCNSIVETLKTIDN